MAGMKEKIKEMLPGTTENKMKNEGMAPSSNYGTTGTGTGSGMGTGTGTGMGTDTGYGNTGTGTGMGGNTTGGNTMGQLKSHIPGTQEHQMKQGTGGMTGGSYDNTGYSNTGGAMGTGTGTGMGGNNTGGSTMGQLKSHIPGTEEHQMKQGTGGSGMGGSYDNTGYSNTTGAMGTGTGTGMGEGHHHHHHHGAEAAGAGALAGAGVATHEHHKHEHHHGTTGNVTGGGVDTPDESIGQKIKKIIPGTEEHKIHQANKQQGTAGGMGTGGAGMTGSGGGVSGGNMGGSSAY